MYIHEQNYLCHIVADLLGYGTTLLSRHEHHASSFISRPVIGQLKATLKVKDVYSRRHRYFHFYIPDQNYGALYVSFPE